jgi:hypothetical protein
MSINESPNSKVLIINALKSCKLSILKNTHKQFILDVLISFLSIKGRINFLQLARFSQHCEQYFRINFEKKFDFQAFNFALIFQQSIEEIIIAFDPSYIPKSGKCTFGLGRYWSGCAQKVKWGLDICGFAAVDIMHNTAFHLNAIQTAPLENEPLLDYYCRIIKNNHMYFKELSKYMVADAYFSKKKVVDTVLSFGMHFISRLRDDAVLLYLYQGEPSGKKGRPKKFDGKVDAKKLNMNYFKEIFTGDNRLKIYSAIAYCKAFERPINLAVAEFYKDGQLLARKLYFSTDLEMDGAKIVRYYRSRFQIEFLYRDAKQYCGLTHCQARSENKLNFHFNAALTTVNLAKLEWLNNPLSAHSSFSMSDYKTMYNNKLLLETFFRKLGRNPNAQKNRQIINELKFYGTIAA